MRFSASAAMMLLIGFVQDPVKARFRSDVFTLVGEPGNDLPGRQAGVFRSVTNIQNALSLCGGQLVRRFRSLGGRTAIRLYLAIFSPALVGTHIDIGYLASWGQAGAIPARGVDQHNGFAAISGADQSSSGSPQIACTFFCNTNRAAASARAFSLRKSSFSRPLMRLRSAFRSDFNLMLA